MLILVSFSCTSCLSFPSCDRAWCPSVMPSHLKRAPPTELVYWNVATRMKSAANALTIRAIRVLLIVGAWPVEPGAADVVGVLERRDPHEIRGERADHQVDLRLADLGDVVVILAQ